MPNWNALVGKPVRHSRAAISRSRQTRKPCPPTHHDPNQLVKRINQPKRPPSSGLLVASFW